MRTYGCSELSAQHDDILHHLSYDLALFSDGFVFVSGRASGLYYSATDSRFYARRRSGGRPDR